MSGDTFDPATISWVMDNRDVDYLVEAIYECEEIVVDLETTGLDEYAIRNGTTNGGYPGRITLASFTVPMPGESEHPPTTYVVPLAHPDSPFVGTWRIVSRVLAQAMKDSERPLVNHNLKFDVRWFYAHTGVDLSSQIVWDTQISSHLLDEISSTKLKERAPVTFGVQRWDDFDLSKPGAADRVPLFDLGVYAARDTYWTWKLAESHRRTMFAAVTAQGDQPMPEFPDEVQNARLGLLATWCAMPTVATLTAVEQRGFALDRDWTRERLSESETASKALLDSLASRYGDIPDLDMARPSFAPTSNWFKAWIDVAVETGDLVVGATTKNGNAQWSKSVLTRQARKGSQEAADLLEYRGHVKRAEYLRSWLSVAQDGIVHATYHAGRVITGRLSATDPNMQQVTPPLRPAFIPRRGFVVADFDYGQIEMRIAAFISRSLPMLTAFKTGQDLHLMNAGAVNGDKTIQAAHLYLMWVGLPPNGTGAEVLQAVRDRTSTKGLEGNLMGLSRALGSDQESGSWERWRAERGTEQPMDRRVESAALSAIPEKLVREVRSEFERMGWPWEWEAHNAGRASHRPQPRQQSLLKLDDAMQVLSSTNASRLESLSEVEWKHFRQMGKAMSFGLIYGMGAMGFKTYAEDAYDVPMSEEAAYRMHDAYFKTWDGLTEWHVQQVAEADRTGQVLSPIGRVRRLPDIWSPNDKRRSHAERNAINSPVQGFASDLMQMAAASIEGNMPGYSAVSGARIIGTVHDSIVAELPEDSWQDVAAECIERMVNLNPILAHMDCELDVPLAVDVKAGSRWGLTDIGIL